MRIRPTPVAALAILVALAGCEKPQEDGMQPDRRFLGTDTTCQKQPEIPPTRPFQEISVDDNEIVVEPDTVVQPPGRGIFGWESADYYWRVTYKGDQAPTEDSTYSGEPGELVWAGVREDAPCRYYAFEVEVWGGDLGDTLTVDPGDLVEPYSF